MRYCDYHSSEVPFLHCFRFEISLQKFEIVFFFMYGRYPSKKSKTYCYHSLLTSEECGGSRSENYNKDSRSRVRGLKVAGLDDSDLTAVKKGEILVI